MSALEPDKFLFKGRYWWVLTKAHHLLGNYKKELKNAQRGRKKHPELFWNPAYLMLWTATVGVHGYAEESIAAIRHAIEWYEVHPDNKHRFELAQAYYVAGQYDMSNEIMKNLIVEDSGNIDFQGFLGTIAARKGNYEKAEMISMYLANPDRLYLFGRHTCWRARIAAISGDEVLVIQLLRDAISQGFDYYSIHEILDFYSLRTYQPFKDLIKPKE